MANRHPASYRPQVVTAAVIQEVQPPPTVGRRRGKPTVVAVVPAGRKTTHYDVGCDCGTVMGAEAIAVVASRGHGRR